MERPPDFFLCAAGGNKDLVSPRACWEEGRLNSPVGNDLMLIQIEPPIIGQQYGWGAKRSRS